MTSGIETRWRIDAQCCIDGIIDLINKTVATKSIIKIKIPASNFEFEPVIKSEIADFGILYWIETSWVDLRDVAISIRRSRPCVSMGVAERKTRLRVELKPIRQWHFYISKKINIVGFGIAKALSWCIKFIRIGISYGVIFIN